MLSTAKSANVGFSVFAQKIPFINSEKFFFGCQQSAQRYQGLVGFITVRFRVRVSIRVSLV